jgi:transposase-like protein
MVDLARSRVSGAEFRIGDSEALESGDVNRPGFAGGSDPREVGAMTKKTPNRYSPEVQRRAVRRVLDPGGDHAPQWAAIGSIAAKIGRTAETLRNWVRQAEPDRGLRPGPASAEGERIRALGRENRGLHQAKEILRQASA